MVVLGWIGYLPDEIYMKVRPRILLVDDHEVFRVGLRTFLKQQRPAWESWGESCDGFEAIRLSTALQPDVVLLDLTMPAMGGVAVLGRLKAVCPETKIVILTLHSPQVVLDIVKQAGANAFAQKSQIADELIQ